MPRIKTQKIAKWSTQRASKAKRDLINRARAAIANQNQGGEPAPITMEVPKELAPPRAKSGRPRLTREGAQSVSVTLTQALHEKAGRIGDGVYSRGIRIALEAYKEE